MTNIEKLSDLANRFQTNLAYYKDAISFAFTEICGRSYGGGVLEILPSEMGKIMLPILDNIEGEMCNSFEYSNTTDFCQSK